MNSNMPAPPIPQSRCAAFAPLLPLLNAGELSAEQAASVRDHLATCAWCRTQLAGYDLIDAAARRHYTGTPAAVPFFQPEELAQMLDEPAAPVYEPLAARPTFSPPTPPRRRLPAFSVIAAVLLVAALAGMFFARQNTTHPGGHLTATPPPHGTIIEYSLAGYSRAPLNIIAGADGNLWFTDHRANAIERITPGGHVQAFAVPTADSGVTGIARAADGMLWFTESDSGRIGSVDTNGKITDYALDIQTKAPMAVTVARDGTIWMTNQHVVGGRANSLVPFAPHGTTQFIWMLPAPDPGLFGITVGPDGNLWFTESIANRIGRLAPTNDLNQRLTAFKEYDPPTPKSAPLFITTGPDGNLWFTEFGANRIGRINPTTGAITEFPLPTPDAQPISITTGPDGNLWFTERHANSIGRITPSGAVKEYPVPTPFAGLYGITAGPDGNLWFTENDRGKVGYIHP